VTCEAALQALKSSSETLCSFLRKATYDPCRAVPQCNGVSALVPDILLQGLNLRIGVPNDFSCLTEAVWVHRRRWPSLWNLSFHSS
jgi:hypothetical protein